MNRWMTPLLLGLAVVVSAIVVVEAKHHNRALIGELEELRIERARLDMEWSQLQLEEATLAHPGKIEKVARERLDMVDPEQTVLIEGGRR